MAVLSSCRATAGQVTTEIQSGWRITQQKHSSSTCTSTDLISVTENIFIVPKQKELDPLVDGVVWIPDVEPGATFIKDHCNKYSHGKTKPAGSYDGEGTVCPGQAGLK